jgi:hypothetical protein
VSELETRQVPEGAAEEHAPREPIYVTQKNPHIPECAFCKRQVAPLHYVLVPRKAGDKRPERALCCLDCPPALLTHTLALLADASEPALKAWHHHYLPELVPAKERKDMAGHIADSGHKRR